MQLLLDTHILIWFINGDKQLDEDVKTNIKNLNNQCYFSMASIWEIAIKTRLEKLDINISFDTLKAVLINNQIELLPIHFEHIQQLLTLPVHHNDPFDRLIISQAIYEDVIVVSKDAKFKLYDIKMI
jgi:PIN domain nuclease of toxin-antitoxin system